MLPGALDCTSARESPLLQEEVHVRGKSSGKWSSYLPHQEAQTSLHWDGALQALAANDLLSHSRLPKNGNQWPSLVAINLLQAHQKRPAALDHQTGRRVLARAEQP
jgi:hypothetical protein